MALQTSGLSHLTLRVSDLQRAKAFYTQSLGFPVMLETDGLILVNAGGAVLGLRARTPEMAPGDRFDPYRVGLDHVALAVENAAVLPEVCRQLDAAEVRNNGVEQDSLTGGTYISFYDPDGIAWELYAMPAS